RRAHDGRNREPSWRRARHGCIASSKGPGGVSSTRRCAARIGRRRRRWPMTTPRARRAGEVLLQSFAQDVSPAYAKRKTLLALGSGAVVASVGVQTAAAAKTANLAGGSAYAGAGVLKVAVVKAAIIGALCGVATLEGAHYLETSSSKPPVVAL